MTLDPRLARRQKLLTLFTIALLAVWGASGCVYRIDIQQGNFLELKDIDRVAVGMSRLQVKSLLGTPMVADPFETSRWDYVYYFKRGRLRKPLSRHFVVFFEEDKVTRIEKPDEVVKPDAAKSS